MNEISVQDLKGRLSAAIAEAEAGQTLIVTRHKTAVARLGPAMHATLHRGPRVGRGRLTPALTNGTRGRALAALLEDRRGR